MEAVGSQWRIETDVFEGPLDLLLYLVKRDSIDLKKLQIAKIADSYLDYLERMQTLRLGVAAEYLVMAATLVHMKSLKLLPRLPVLVEEESEEDPAAALARQLLEYQRYKQAAEELVQRPIVGRDVFVREPESVARADRPVTAGINAFGLLDLYFHALQRSRQPPPVHHLAHNGPDLDTCCTRVLAYLDSVDGVGMLGELLAIIESLEERIVSFIAVLEMTRLGWLDLTQEEHLGAVCMMRRPEIQVDLALLTGRVSGVDVAEGRA
jgi:segregation and condensation protein A